MKKETLFAYLAGLSGGLAVGMRAPAYLDRASLETIGPVLMILFVVFNLAQAHFAKKAKSA